MTLREEYEELDELKSIENERVYLIEEQIDIDVQSEYFKFSSELKKHVNAEKAIQDYPYLFDENLSLNAKKRILSNLACTERVETFRLLEDYKNRCSSGLKDWATLAYNESKMILESSLSEQKQVFISTGMGGRNGMLRYFMVLFPYYNSGFTSFQKTFIQEEVEFSFERKKAVVDYVDTVHDEYISFYILIPIKTNVEKLLNDTFSSCNQLGLFLNEKFILTNIKAMDHMDIMKFAADKAEWEEDRLLDRKFN